jgi:hypothetical protein
VPKVLGNSQPATTGMKQCYILILLLPEIPACGKGHKNKELSFQNYLYKITVPPKLIHSCLVPKINNKIQGKVMYAFILKSLLHKILEYCCTL